MGTISRSPKTGGGTGDYITGAVIEASEVNDDINQLYTLINGNIDSDNIDASANIPDSALAGGRDPAGIDDFSEDTAEAFTIITPGDSGTAAANLATNLPGELIRLRYQIQEMRGYTDNAYFTNSSNVLTALSWLEPPVLGPNLLPNPGFEDQSTAGTATPAGWSDVGSPSFLMQDPAAATAARGGIEKRNINIVGGASDGISTIVGGLKPSTKYLVGMQITRATGTISLITAGGQAAGNDYQDFTISVTTGTANSIYNGVVQTTSAGADITVTVQGGAASTDFDLHRVWLHELSTAGPTVYPPVAALTATDAVNADLVGFIAASANTWYKQEMSSLALEQYIPGPGYRLIFEARVVGGTTSSSGSIVNQSFLAELLLSVAGGADAVVDGPYVTFDNVAGTSNFTTHIFNLKYVLDNPTPGSIYEFAVQMGALANSNVNSNISLNPLVGGEQTVSRSWLRLEKL